MEYLYVIRKQNILNKEKNLFFAKIRFNILVAN